MSPVNNSEQDKSSFARIIDAVKTFPGFCTLIVLTLSPIFTAVSLNMQPDQKFVLIRYVLGGFGLLVFVNLAYFLYEGRTELTFQIRFSRSATGNDPVDGISVKLYKNQNKIAEALTNEEGVVSFSVNVGRKDEIYVQIDDPKLPALKAALCNRGRFEFVRTVVVRQNVA